MKFYINVWLSLLVFVPIHSMEIEEKLILIVEPNDTSPVQNMILETIEDKLVQNKLINEALPKVSLKDAFDLICNTPKDAHGKFPNSPLHIVMLGASAPTIEDNPPAQTFTSQFLDQIYDVSKEMAMKNLKLGYQCLKVSISEKDMLNDRQTFRSAVLGWASLNSLEIDKIINLLKSKI